MINPGKLNKLITLQVNTAVGKRDEIGGKLPATWEDYLKCWAGKETGTVAQKEYSGQHMNYVPVTFTIRKPDTDIDTAMRIVLDGDIYKIISIMEMETVPAYYRIDTNLLKAGG